VLVQPGAGQDLRLRTPAIIDPADLAIAEPDTVVLAVRQERQVPPGSGPARNDQEPFTARGKPHRPRHERKPVLAYYLVIAEAGNPQPGARKPS
jgi:hypothetical protein